MNPVAKALKVCRGVGEVQRVNGGTVIRSHGDRAVSEGEGVIKGVHGGRRTQKDVVGWVDGGHGHQAFLESVTGDGRGLIFDGPWGARQMMVVCAARDGVLLRALSQRPGDGLDSRVCINLRLLAGSLSEFPRQSVDAVETPSNTAATARLGFVAAHLGSATSITRRPKLGRAPRSAPCVGGRLDGGGASKSGRHVDGRRSG